MAECSNLIVVTGGPGAGKTTLVQALGAYGLMTSAEAGRCIIRAQMSIGGNALPWGDRHAFAALMLSWDIRSYEERATDTRVTIFDRGLPDIIGYLELEKLPIPDHFRRAAESYRYNRRVFIAPPWPEIFIKDTERRQTMEKAEQTHDAMSRTYAALGYDLIPLPLAPIVERVRFVIDRMNDLDGDSQT